MDIFFHDFKFDLTLPSPIPDSKYTFYPFEQDRYTKAKFTNLNYMEKPPIYTTPDLSIPIDDINIRPEWFIRSEEMGPPELTIDDAILLGEKKKVVMHTRENRDIAQLELAREDSEVFNEKLHASERMDVEEEIDLDDPMLKEVEIHRYIREKVERSFEEAKKLKITEHPTKKGVKLQKMMSILPNFEDVDKSFAVVSFEVSAPILSGKNALYNRKNDHGLKVMSEFLEEDKNEDEMGDESKIKLLHNHDYLYFNHKGETYRKEFLVNRQYCISFDLSSPYAKYSPFNSEVTLRRILAPPRQSKSSLPTPLIISLRLPYKSEALSKFKRIRHIHSHLTERYAVKEYLPDPLTDFEATKGIRAELAERRRREVAESEEDGDYSEGVEDGERIYGDDGRADPSEEDNDEDDQDDQDNDEERFGEQSRKLLPNYRAPERVEEEEEDGYPKRRRNRRFVDDEDGEAERVDPRKKDKVMDDFLGSDDESD